MKFSSRIILFIFSCVSILWGVNSFAQSKEIDSLKNVIRTEIDDTNKIKNLNDLAWDMSMFKTDTAIVISKVALKLSNSIKFGNGNRGWEFGIGQSLHQIGYFSYLVGDYEIALDYYGKALNTWDKLEKENGQIPLLKVENYKSKTIGNIGMVYFDEGNYPKALTYYLDALKIKEETKNKDEIAKTLGNIGILYDDQGNYEMALNYYHQSKKINEEIGNKIGIAIQISNIGSVYFKKHDYSNALANYFVALKMAEDLHLNSGISIQLGNIGAVYENEGNFPLALDYYFKALEMKKKLGEKKGISLWLGNIGKVYTHMKDYSNSKQFLLRAVGISDSIHAYKIEKGQLLSLSELYSLTGNYKDALLEYKKYSELKDTLFNQEKDKEITRKQLNYEFEKKQAEEKIEQDKKDAATDAEARRQKIILSFVIGGLALVVLFAGFIFRSLRITRKQKEIIEIKSRETELQKILIEEKNKDILDSIHYAKRIQQSLMPTEKYIHKSLNRLKLN